MAIKLPNGPRTPRLLRLPKFIVQPLEYMDDNYQRYGDIFKVGGEKSPSFVYVGNPEGIKQIFTANPDLFEYGGGNARSIIRYLLGDNSVVLLHGDRHHQLRKLLMPPFHGDRLREYSELICDITNQVTNSWSIGKPFLVRPTMQEITLRVILQAVFGLHQGERSQQLRQLISSLLDSISSPLNATLIFFPSLRQDWGSLSPWGRFLRLRQQVRQLLYEEIRERRQEIEAIAEKSPAADEYISSKDYRTDILSLLILARDEEGQGLTDEELHDQLMTLLLAGHETTASALTWAFYWVHHLPEVGDKLLAELDRLGSNADPNQLARLPYLTAVCQETLRIYPIAVGASIKKLKSPMKIMDYELPAGTVLMPSIYLVHQREDLYPQPKCFKPERFLQRQYSPYEYFPFGGSNRRCIGSALAMLEMKLVLATILSRFELALTNNRPLKPVRRGLTLAPPANMRMVANQLRSQKTPILV